MKTIEGPPWLVPHTVSWFDADGRCGEFLPSGTSRVVRLTAPAGVLRAEHSDGTAWWHDAKTGTWTQDTSRGWDALG